MHPSMWQRFNCTTWGYNGIGLVKMKTWPVTSHYCATHHALPRASRTSKTEFWKKNRVLQNQQSTPGLAITCSHVRARDDSITVVRQPHLQDGPQKTWRQQPVACGKGLPKVLCFNMLRAAKHGRPGLIFLWGAELIPLPGHDLWHALSQVVRCSMGATVRQQVRTHEVQLEWWSSWTLGFPPPLSMLFWIWQHRNLVQFRRFFGFF